MSCDFAASYALCRGRFDQELADLTDAQMQWRMYPGSLSIGEMALHLAGVEIWFIHQMNGQPIPAEYQLLVSCATEGVVNDNPFPIPTPEITAAKVKEALATARGLVDPVVSNPTDAQRAATIQSALGPIIDGTGALARIAFHPGYHHGQAYQMRMHPDFPA
ncbi:hypothetical protein CCB81_01270 [Armatimonadetes bacterium Uphvl-Ar2]|nr:hypothetical protein CCB81_01270 [Armatimonadetes bacterium Uphvl-Ar2]